MINERAPTSRPDDGRPNRPYQGEVIDLLVINKEDVLSGGKQEKTIDKEQEINAKKLNARERGKVNLGSRNKWGLSVNLEQEKKLMKRGIGVESKSWQEKANSNDNENEYELKKKKEEEDRRRRRKRFVRDVNDDDRLQNETNDEPNSEINGIKTNSSKQTKGIESNSIERKNSSTIINNTQIGSLECRVEKDTYLDFENYTLYTCSLCYK